MLRASFVTNSSSAAMVKPMHEAPNLSSHHSHNISSVLSIAHPGCKSFTPAQLPSPEHIVDMLQDPGRSRLLLAQLHV